MNQDKPNFVDYLLVLFIVLIGASHAFIGRDKYLYVFILPITLLIYLYRRGPINTKVIFTLISLFCVFYIRGIFVGQNLFGVSQIVLTFMSCFFISYCLKFTFNKVFVVVIFYLCLISLVLWPLSSFSTFFRDTLVQIGQMFPQFENNLEVWEHDTNPSVSLYFYEVGLKIKDWPRNAGPFFEPGRFATVILIAIVLEIFNNKGTFLTKKIIVFILTLATTFSTMGYVGFIFIFCFYCLFSKINTANKFLLVIFSILVAYFLFNLDFMGDKISGEMSNNVTDTRMGGLLYHIDLITQRPIWGGEILMRSPNGLTYIFASWGIPIGIVYYYFLYKGSTWLVREKKLKYLGLMLFIVLLINGFAQNITMTPLYYTIISFAITKTFRIAKSNKIKLYEDWNSKSVSLS